MQIDWNQNGVKDSAKSTVAIERELFFKFDSELRDKLDIIEKTKQIRIGGDNLVTRKQMYRRMHSAKKSPDIICNDDKLSSFILLPLVIGDRNSSVNTKRNSVSGYNDNPFAFVTLLKELYMKEFEISQNSYDKLEWAMYQTREYWKIFGSGVDGFEKYISTFCLTCIYELEKNDKYKKFFCKKKYGKEEWEDYDELISQFAEMRKKEMHTKFGVTEH